MTFPDLRAFIDQLRRDRDLVEIAAPVDPELEAAEIHRRVIAAGGPALLFTNVKGAAFPLVTNLFGTARRAELAFGDAAARVSSSASCISPRRCCRRRRRSSGARATSAVELLKVGTRRHRRRTGPRGRHRRRAARSAAGDHLLARRWRTVRHAAAGLHARIPTARPQPRHVPACRSTTGARPACTGRSARAAAFTTRAPKRATRRCRLTVFLGGPPALILSAIAPLPENVPELMLASLIAGERLPQVAAPSGHPHPLIATRGVRADGRGGAAASASPKGRSAITTATTRCSTTIRSSRSSRSRIAATRSIPRRWSESRGRRISSSAICCRSCCRRSSRW